MTLLTIFYEDQMRGLGPDNLRALDLSLLEEVQVKDPNITHLWSYQKNMKRAGLLLLS